MSGAAEHLLPRQFHFHRTLDNFRRHRRENCVGPNRTFAAERAANKGTNHVHVFLLQAERVRYRALRALHILSRIVYG